MIAADGFHPVWRLMEDADSRPDALKLEYLGDIVNKDRARRRGSGERADFS